MEETRVGPFFLAFGPCYKAGGKGDLKGVIVIGCGDSREPVRMLALSWHEGIGGLAVLLTRPPSPPPSILL